MHKPRFESLVNWPIREDLQKQRPNEKRQYKSLSRSLSLVQVVYVRQHCVSPQFRRGCRFMGLLFFLPSFLLSFLPSFLFISCFLSFCLSVCLPVCLCLSLPLCLSVCLCLSLSFSLSLSLCLSVCLSLSLVPV